jgi:8-oxo-dGTP diphosphatase
MKDKSFLNPTLVVDIVLFTIEDGDLKVLLINRDGDPFKGFEALPGGYLLAGETTKTAAERVLKEKAGVSDIYIEQLYTFDELNRDPRGPVFSVTYLALVPPSLQMSELLSTN